MIKSHQEVFNIEDLTIIKYTVLNNIDYYIYFFNGDKYIKYGDVKTRYQYLYQIKTKTREFLLQNTSLESKCKICTIDDFHPFLNTPFKKRKRILPRNLLDIIKEGSKMDDIKLIYGITGKKLMQRLLVEKGYKTSFKTSNEYYLLI